MLYYVYKVTDSTNGKVYIGKRAHRDPRNDRYMGSGKLIMAAIKKRGIDAFSKEILAIFDNHDDCARLEAELVTKDFIREDTNYNLHEGGFGGFAHINNLPIAERPNLIKLKANIVAGVTKVGGTQNWTTESFERVRYQGWGARRDRGEICDTNPWKNLSSIERELRSADISTKITGENNGMYGTHYYTNGIERIQCKPEECPTGWVTTSEYTESLKVKDSPNYGRHWYNDGIDNHYYFDDNIKIVELNLKRGRLNCTFKKTA